MAKVVIDTNVFVGALIGVKGDNRQIIRLCLDEKLFPQMGNALLCEYEDVIVRPEILKQCPLKNIEINVLLNGLLAVSEWSEIYYLWRPNLRDEKDNHVLELAVASGASHIITNNVRDFKGSELIFDWLKIVSPKVYLNEYINDSNP